MDKTIVNIERISDCFLKLNIAKSGFYNFESDALDHSATLPTVDFIRLFVCRAKTKLALVAYFKAHKHRQPKNDGELMPPRPDGHILRQTTH